LLVGIETSDDAAVWRLDHERAIVATTDFFMPIVDDPWEFGRIAATNAISDVYAMGGRPLFALALVGMPINVLSKEDIGRILDGGARACADAGIVIAGGHTIDSVEPIYGLVAIGLVHPERMRRNCDGRAGDDLVLGKPLGVGIYSAALKKGLLPEDAYRAMIAATTKLNTPGPELAELPGVHAITDVTGFGLLGHGWEVARGAGLQLTLQWDSVPFLPGVADLAAQGHVTGASGRNWAGIAQHVDLGPADDPVRRALICDPQTAGGLLVSCEPGTTARVLDMFRAHGFAEATVVGRLEAGSPAVAVR
jgi:selenide,water dikinase